MNSEENIPLLQNVLEEYKRGTLDMSVRARKCFLSAKEKVANRITWIHNDELESHCILRNIATNNAKDFLKQTREKL